MEYELSFRRTLVKTKYVGYNISNLQYTIESFGKAYSNNNLQYPLVYYANFYTPPDELPEYQIQCSSDLDYGQEYVSMLEAFTWSIRHYQFPFERGIKGINNNIFSVSIIINTKHEDVRKIRETRLKCKVRLLDRTMLQLIYQDKNFLQLRLTDHSNRKYKLIEEGYCLISHLKAAHNFTLCVLHLLAMRKMCLEDYKDYVNLVQLAKVDLFID